MNTLVKPEMIPYQFTYNDPSERNQLVHVEVNIPEDRCDTIDLYALICRIAQVDDANKLNNLQITRLVPDKQRKTSTAPTGVSIPETPEPIVDEVLDGLQALTSIPVERIELIKLPIGAIH